MTDTLKLEMSRGDFHDLHLALDKTRADGSTVKAPKDAYRKLLLDHAAALRTLHDHGVETVDAAEKEGRA